MMGLEATPTAAEPRPAPSLKVTIPGHVARLASQVCHRHGLTTSDLWSDMTDRATTDCRGELVWRLKHMDPPTTISQLSRWFRRSRGQIMAAIKQHQHLRNLAQRGAFL